MTELIFMFDGCGSDYVDDSADEPAFLQSMITNNYHQLKYIF
jgi:hypothetical protein